MAGLGNPLTEKCLINISYCPHQNLGDFFIDKLSAEVSNAFSATDNILLFGDYNIDMLSLNGKKSLQNFAAGLGLQLSNIDIPTRISNNKRSLIDHYFSTNEQINSWKVCLPPFDIDHNVVFFQSKLFLLENKIILLNEIQKILSMENLIEIWLLQIGEQFMNRETAMKCLQSLTEFF